MTTSLFSDEPTQCPECATPGPLPLLDGPPSDEMLTAAQLGHIALATGPSSDPPAQWRCQEPRCSAEF
jgi:hypothetical protein